MQLAQVAAQATLYDLGVQALVAGNHQRARRLLTAYGREYPSRAVLSSLGTSYLAEALQEYQQLVRSGLLQVPDFYFPLLLDARAQAAPADTTALRGAPGATVPQRIKRLLAERS